MFDRKGKKKRLAISVKALTVKDIERAIGRIDSEFPDKGAEEYAGMRRDLEGIAEMTVLAHALEAKGKKVTLEDILKEVLG